VARSARRDMRRRRFLAASAAAFGALVRLGDGAPNPIHSWALGSVQEWQVSNAKLMHGPLRIAEVGLFADPGCSKPLRLPAGGQGLNASVFASHIHAQQVDLSGKVLHPGVDCVDACNGKPGYCAWCGESAACCRKGFQANPQECQRAQGFTTAGHECVAVPTKAMRAVTDGELALDGNMGTVFKVPCEGAAGCPAGSIVLGGVLPRGAPAVGCIRVSQSRDHALHGGAALSAAVIWRPMPSHAQATVATLLAPSGAAARADAAGGCPGACRSGRYLDGGLEGVCKEFLGPQGLCSGGFDTNSINCQGCADLQARSSRVLFSVGNRTASDASVLTDLTKRGAELWRRPAPLKNVGEDCWGPCISGYCDWCGDGNACCKQGSPDDNPECATAQNYVVHTHHECVALDTPRGVMIDSSALPLPPWVLGTAVVLPWAALLAAMAYLLCRWQRRRPEAKLARDLSGEVFINHRVDERKQRKVLKDSAKGLEWLS